MEKEKLVQNYIDRCNQVLERNDNAEAIRLRGLIVSAFDQYIENMNDVLSTHSYSYREGDNIGDIERLKAKLESFLALGGNINNSQSSLPGQQININNSSNNSNSNSNTFYIDLKIEFDNARKAIEENESLSEDEIQEVLEKINKIEDISKTDESKNKKWFKLRPMMEWLGTKGVSVATTILNLITAILKYKS